MERLDLLQQLELLDRNKHSMHQLLDYTNWVDDLNQKQVDDIAAFFQAYSAPVGTILINEGEKATFFGILCEGGVDIVKESSSGRLKKLKTLGPGKAFGEMAFFDRSPSSTTVIVKEKALLLLMDEANFNTLCSHYPYLAIVVTIKIIRTVSQRLRETSGRLIDHL